MSDEIPATNMRNSGSAEARPKKCRRRCDVKWAHAKHSVGNAMLKTAMVEKKPNKHPEEFVGVL